MLAQQRPLTSTQVVALCRRQGQMIGGSLHPTIAGCHKLHRRHLLSQRFPVRYALNQRFGLGFSKNILGDAVEISASSDLPNHGLTPEIVGCLLIADGGFLGWISVRFFPQSTSLKINSIASRQLFLNRRTPGSIPSNSAIVFYWGNAGIRN